MFLRFTCKIFFLKGAFICYIKLLKVQNKSPTLIITNIRYNIILNINYPTKDSDKSFKYSDGIFLSKKGEILGKFLISAVYIVLKLLIPLISLILDSNLIKNIEGKLKLQILFFQDINNEAIRGIQKLYEVDNKISKKKLLIISIFMNLSYGFALYVGGYQNSQLINEQFKSIPFFIISGVIFIFLQEYFAYTISKRYFQNYIKTKKISTLFNGMGRVFIYLFVVPFLIEFILFNTDSLIVKLIMTWLIYFSQVGMTLMSLGYFEYNINIIFRIICFIPVISVFFPYIIFFLYNKFVITTIIKFLNSFSRIGYKIITFKNNNMSKIFILSYLFDVAIFIIVLYLY